MTNAELLAKIKAEIDKLYGEYKDKFHQCGDQYHLGLYDGLDMAKRVLDSIESEKPVPKDLEEAAKKFSETYRTTGERTWEDDLLLSFIAGAEWQKQHDAELIEIAYNDGITIGMTKQKELMMKEAVEGVVCYGSKGAYIETDFLGEYDTDVYGNPGDKVRIIILRP